jgi:hypothetical protein
MGWRSHKTQHAYQVTALAVVDSYCQEYLSDQHHLKEAHS